MAFNYFCRIHLSLSPADSSVLRCSWFSISGCLVDRRSIGPGGLWIKAREMLAASLAMNVVRM